jgi:hypothetical protein
MPEGVNDTAVMLLLTNILKLYKIYGPLAYVVSFTRWRQSATTSMPDYRAITYFETNFDL